LLLLLLLPAASSCQPASAPLLELHLHCLAAAPVVLQLQPPAVLQEGWLQVLRCVGLHC
jgi:hypothetical protein